MEKVRVVVFEAIAIAVRELGLCSLLEVDWANNRYVDVRRIVIELMIVCVDIRSAAFRLALYEGRVMNFNSVFRNHIRMTKKTNETAKTINSLQNNSTDADEPEIHLHLTASLSTYIESASRPVLFVIIMTAPCQDFCI